MDAIVSTGPPHSMHLIARKLSLATGIPWVADFRDPWTRMFYFKHLGLTGRSERRHHKLEKQVLDDASVIVAVSPPVQRDFQSMTDTPVRLITNVTVPSGSKFRGWLVSTVTGQKATTADVITADITLTALVTDIEGDEPNESNVFNLKKKYFYPEDHEAFNPTSAYSYNSSQHGWTS